MDFFGVKLLGLTAENGRKLALTLALFVAVWLVSVLGRELVHWLQDRKTARSAGFWALQGFSLLSMALVIVGLISIWIDNNSRLATFGGVASAGIAFALQKPITAIVGYFVILRSRAFKVGDRIAMGGVRGDVLSLSLLETTIMEMGQPEGEKIDDPAVWIRSRQFTGRIATVTNDRIFQEAVFNYTREFPYLWEEMRIPLFWNADRSRAERILLDCAARHTVGIKELSQPHLQQLRERYGIDVHDATPRVYMRITDRWLELTVRFLVRDHGSRDLKDMMSREILDAFQEAGLEIAGDTYPIVSLPPIRLAPETTKALANALAGRPLIREDVRPDASPKPHTAR